MTGGAGFIGSHLVEQLLHEGFSVHVVDDLSSGSMENLGDAVASESLRITVGSVAAPEVAQRALDDADVVFHLAGVVGVRRLASEPLDVMQANLRCTEVVLQAAADRGVSVLTTSSSEVYGDGPVPFQEDAPVVPGVTEGLRGGYACAKAMGEWLASAHAAQSGLPVIVARLFNTVGPRQAGDHGMVLPRFVQQALQGDPLTVYGEGAQTRCFAHVREVARALVGLAQSTSVPGRVVNVGSAVESSVSELAATVIDVAGSRSEIQRVPFHDVFPRGFVDPPRRVPALDRLRAANGWVPEAGLRELVEDVVSAARAAFDAAGARVGSASPATSVVGQEGAASAPKKMPGVLANAGHRNGSRNPHPRSLI
ncbi:MAG: NAD-dependent epimerase/dehydratase family protein, partial [Planctomycetota bacterium]|nr:NAD-dependent epimerase/dehydratase family protein [Planctomycetota bacterium]